VNRRAQEGLNHFTSDDKRMAVLAAEFRHNRPDLFVAGKK
jgi:hypothetical protein